MGIGDQMLLEFAATSGHRIFQLPTPLDPTANSVAVVGKPTNAQLKVPPGFEVKLFARGLDQPRLLRVAPNGDIFVVGEFGRAHSSAAGPAPAATRSVATRSLHPA